MEEMNARFFGHLEPVRVREVAWLADIAYNNGTSLDTRLAGLGWMPLGAADLGLAPSLFDAQGYFVNANASAFVAVHGSTLALSFTGSTFGDLNDFFDVAFDQAGYYARLEPLIDATLSYVAASPEIDTLTVTGHSLGGAMADRFAAAEGPTLPAGLDVSIMSLASPGTDLVSSGAVSRSVVEVQHTGDPVPTDLTQLVHNGMPAPITDESTPDSADLFDLLFRYLFDLPNEHAVDLYVANIGHITSTSLYGFTTPATAVTILGGGNDAYGDTHDVQQTLILGLDGSDVISGGAGPDLIDGGGASDDLMGGSGNDALVGGPGNDRLDGGAGDDVGDYRSDPAGITVALGTDNGSFVADGFGGVDLVIDIEVFLGSAFADILLGDGANNILDGQDGDDGILGRGGDDTLRGGAGNDFMLGGAGRDLIEGGEGVDVLSGNDDFLVPHDGETDTFAYSQVPASLPDIDGVDFDPTAPELGGDVFDFRDVFAALPNAQLIGAADGAGNSWIGVADNASFVVLAFVVGVAEPGTITDDNILV